MASTSFLFDQRECQQESDLIKAALGATRASVDDEVVLYGVHIEELVEVLGRGRRENATNY